MGWVNLINLVPANPPAQEETFDNPKISPSRLAGSCPMKLPAAIAMFLIAAWAMSAPAQVVSDTLSKGRWCRMSIRGNFSVHRRGRCPCHRLGVV